MFEFYIFLLHTTDLMSSGRLDSFLNLNFYFFSDVNIDVIKAFERVDYENLHWKNFVLFSIYYVI